jgi:hypothetical protein
VSTLEKTKAEAEYHEKILSLYPKILFVITLIASLIDIATIWVYGALREQNVHRYTVLTFTSCQVLFNLSLSVLFGVFGFGNPAAALIGNLHSLCIVIGEGLTEFNIQKPL